MCDDSVYHTCDDDFRLYPRFFTVLFLQVNIGELFRSWMHGPVAMMRRWSSGASLLEELLAQHNEHRLPLVRLAYLVDFSVFDGRSTFTYPLLLLNAAGLGTLLGI